MFDVPLQLHQNFIADRVNGLNLVVPMLPQMRAANQLNTKWLLVMAPLKDDVNIWLTFEHHMNYQGSPINLISPCPPAGSTPIHPQYPSNSGFSHIFIGCTSILASPIEHIWTSCFTGQWKLSCNWKFPMFHRFTVSLPYGACCRSSGVNSCFSSCQSQPCFCRSSATASMHRWDAL